MVVDGFWGGGYFFDPVDVHIYKKQICVLRIDVYIYKKAKFFFICEVF